MARAAIVFAAAALFAIVLTVSAVPTIMESREMFEQFAQKFGKTYRSEEEKLHRFGVFVDNLAIIEAIKLADRTAEYGVTPFSDLTREEFHGMYLSSSMSQLPEMIKKYPVGSVKNTTDVPDTFDWRTVSPPVVTDVKNQGGCGSCWSFSTTGNIEGQWALAGHQLVSLSEQNLVDCDHECDPQNPQSCDAGCNGGLMNNAYEYVIKNGGIDTEESYPYEGVDGQCRFNKANVGALISSWERVSEDEDVIKTYLYQHGPLSVALNAGNLQFYVGGVSDPVICDPKSLDHGVLLVGYGRGRTVLGVEVDYWLVKNSWGGSWGEKGYFRMVRGKGKCGINTSVMCSKV